MALGFGLALPLSGSASAAAETQDCDVVDLGNSALCSAVAYTRNGDGSISAGPGAAAPVDLPPPPAGPATLLSQTFQAPDGTFVTDGDFWGTPDRGRAVNPEWLAESGTVVRQGGTARVTSPVFRMWTRRTDLAHVTAETSVRFDGFVGGDGGWHGINLWLNATVCTPVPGCSALNDGGNSGYALDFMNRDGSMTILKKVPGDTRASSPQGAIDYAWGGTYYWMTSTTWTPERGRTYRFTGRAIDNGNGTTTLQVLIDGQLKLEVLDDGRMGGPRLTGGRVGLRSDYADMTFDDLTISR